MSTKGKSSYYRDRDRQVLWHPFTQQKLWMDEAFPVIERGEGVYLFDVDGKRYLDGVSSLWLNVHGHNRPEINKAIEDQLHKIAHSTFLGLSHPPGIELAERLVKITPPGLTRCFFSDNGSTAMEIALKMAFQFWTQQEPAQERGLFVSFVNAYHGDTVGSVSLGGIDLFHAAYGPLLFPTIKVPAPYCYRCPEGQAPEDCKNDQPRCLKKLADTLEQVSPQVAAVVLEPRVQAAAGILVQPPGFLRGVRELCNQHDTLLIADEVAVGFGRTGPMFACASEAVSPDIMALGKGLTGGYLPLAATMTGERIYDAFLGDNQSSRTFFHGHSYTANPLACAAALASLDLFDKDRTLENVAARGKQMEMELKKFEDLHSVGDVRQCGMMVGIELVADKKNKEPFPGEMMMGRRVILKAREKGLIIRPLGDVVVLMPPLCVSESELKEILAITHESIAEAVGSR